MEKRLYRDELNKKLAGVCAGLAEYLNIDVTIIRVVFLLTIIFKGGGALAYIILWIVLPKKPITLYKNPNSSEPYVDYTVPPQSEPFNPFRAGTPPFNPATPPFAVKPKKNSDAGLIVGGALVLFGSFFLLQQLDIIPFLSFHQVWPVILIAVGAMVIFSGIEKKPKPVDETWEAEKKDENISFDDIKSEDKPSSEQ